MSQLLTASLDMEDGECFNQLFVSLYKSQMLTADVLVKVSCLLPCSLRLHDVSLGRWSTKNHEDMFDCIISTAQVIEIAS